MSSKYTLQSSAEGAVIVLSTSSIGIVAESLFPVLSDRIRSQSVEDLVFVSSTSFEPGVQLVHHHSLDLS
jgi:hypothetical protein